MRLSARLTLAAASLLMALALVEVGYRLVVYRSWSIQTTETPNTLREPHATRGWTHVAGAAALLRTEEYAVPLRNNTRGLRDVEHSIPADPDVFRVVVLGDSFMQAHHVPLEDSLPRLLERNLGERTQGRRIEVINLGVGGYGTAQEYLFLREEGLRYGPDLVVLALYAENDIHNNHAGLERLFRDENAPTYYGRPFAQFPTPDAGPVFSPPDIARLRASYAAKSARVEKPSGSWLDQWALGRLAKRSWTSARQRAGEDAGFDPNVWLGCYADDFDARLNGQVATVDEYRRMWQEAWDVTFRLMRATRDLAHENDARFAVLLVPSKLQVDDEAFAECQRRYPQLSLDRERPTRKVVEFAVGEGIAIVDPHRAFQQAESRDRHPLFFAIDQHWNARGHAVAADELARFLVDERIVPAKSENVAVRATYDGKVPR